MTSLEKANVVVELLRRAGCDNDEIEHASLAAQRAMRAMSVYFDAAKPKRTDFVAEAAAAAILKSLQLEREARPQ